MSLPEPEHDATWRELLVIVGLFLVFFLMIGFMAHQT